MNKTLTMEAESSLDQARAIGREGLDRLISILLDQGYRVIGPRVEHGAVVLGDIRATADLPVGWKEKQEPGHYVLSRRHDEALFGTTVGPQAWKRYLFPPSEDTLVHEADGRSLVTVREAAGEITAPLAFLGVRACDLAAINVLDEVLLRGRYVDDSYRARRAGLVVIAVNCTAPAATCFCASTGTGPEAGAACDLRLTELPGNGAHVLVAEAMSTRGQALLAALPSEAVAAGQRKRVRELLAAAVAQQVRRLPHDVEGVLARSRQSSHWDDVARRCLGCANCTQVCPTCFCWTIRDVPDLAMQSFTRRREWDSCFTLDFSTIGGGSVRGSARSRYRHWITHKLSTWRDQFGVGGCVGCGRCITWCPAGIDLTEEANELAAREDGGGHNHGQGS